MSDPAIEAAKRAWEADQLSCWPSFNAEEGAREALKPLRELHKPREWEWHNEPRVSCECGLHPWPCATAKLVYTSEELA